MGVSEILERIRASAEEERQRIIDDARKRADEMIAEAKASLEKHLNQVRAREERRGMEEKARIIRSARLEARRIRWTAEEELTQEIFEEAKRRLSIVREQGFAGKSYEDILASLIKESAMSIAYTISQPSLISATSTASTSSSTSDTSESEETGEAEETEKPTELTAEEEASLEVIVSEEDASFINDEMLARISDEVASETGVDVKLSLSPERIRSLGGVIVRRKDGKVEVNNTYEKRIERLMPSLRERVAKILWT